MVPIIKIHRPSSENVDEFNEFIDLDDVSIHDSGAVRCSEADELMTGDVEENGPLDASKSRRMSSEEERMKWWRIYAMHFLFSWNSRTFEYVSIFLVALAFPKGLFATSIRGITSTVSALLCSSAVGHWIDQSSSRLPTLLITIFINHAAIIGSYCCWLFWPVIAENDYANAAERSSPFASLPTGILYSLILLLDVVHDLSAIGNRLSMERDWVPVLVGPITSETTYGLTQVNSVMVRLELIVKLVAPSMLPVIMSSFGSREAWIWLLVVVTLAMWAAEVYFARLVASDNPELQDPKKRDHDAAILEDLETEDRLKRPESGAFSLPRKMYFLLYQNPAVRLKHFFSIRMWPASISLALLQVTVLAYSATMITYLLQTGFSISVITVTRASGAITGLASTVITPWFVGILRNRYLHVSAVADEGGKDDAAEVKVVRTVGLWGIVFQFLCLIPVVIVLWNLSSFLPAEMLPKRYDTVSSAAPHILITIIFFAFLSASRIGHYMNSLMVQELGQVEIPVTQRSTYAGTEQSFRSLGELGHWAATVVWSHPNQFKWLALGSLMLVGASLVIFGTWSREALKKGGGRYESVPMEEFEDDASL